LEVALKMKMIIQFTYQEQAGSKDSLMQEQRILDAMGI